MIFMSNLSSSYYTLCSRSHARVSYSHCLYSFYNAHQNTQYMCMCICDLVQCSTCYTVTRYILLQTYIYIVYYSSKRHRRTHVGNGKYMHHNIYWYILHMFIRVLHVYIYKCHPFSMCVCFCYYIY